jgi:hypothetical protein
LDPVVLKTKYGRFGDGSGNLNLEGNVALPWVWWADGIKLHAKLLFYLWCQKQQFSNLQLRYTVLLGRLLSIIFLK